MENHPIPQDVTGFKFKLIGSITVKQFMYLVAPAILSYLIFAAPVIHIIFKIPIILLFSLTGLAIAFLPIDGRPLDTMFFNFLKAIPSENQYIYRKRGVLLFSEELIPKKIISAQKQASQMEKQRLRKEAVLSRILTPYSEADQAEVDFLGRVKMFFDQAAKAADATVAQKTTIPRQTPIDFTQVFMQKEEKTTQPKQENQEKTVEEKKEKEAEEKGDEVGINQEEVYKRAKEKAEEAQKRTTPKTLEQSHTVKTVSPASSMSLGFPTLPDIPNIILGQVVDPRGKVLQNILVEVLDRDNNPVRAFKTNALGQFISATRLPNGVYKIIFTDPKKQHEFDTIEIVLTGTIFSPLQVTSVDAREKLRRELFGA